MMRLLALTLSALALLAVPASAAAPPAPVPDPTYKSVTEVLVPMDDGVNIATTVAIPSKDGTTPLPGPFPIVLEMTPYSGTKACGGRLHIAAIDPTGRA